MARLLLLSAVVLALCARSFGLRAGQRALRFRSTLRLSADGGSVLDEFREKLYASDYTAAYNILKRNPMVVLNKEDARYLLNGVERITADIGQDKPLASGADFGETNRGAEICTFIFKRLERQQVLQGFGCVGAEEYPEAATEISPQKLEQISGLGVAALTPKQGGNSWLVAGSLLVFGQLFLGDALGLGLGIEFDPLLTTIPLTLFALGYDQLANRGAGFEAIYQYLFPVYKEKVVFHEAGHFLLCYLLGVPIRGYITSAWEALKKYPEIKGQAGTIFYDGRFAEEIASGKVTRSSLNRLSVITMAGIAAEAMRYDKAEGGASDEQSLISFFTSIQPPWTLARIQGQARWAVLQAILLLREHKSSYDALAIAMAEGRGLGDCVLAIEEHLPQTMPSAERRAEREAKKKSMESDMMSRYIQKMTWKVGGIEEMEASELDNFDIGLDGFIIKDKEGRLGSPGGGPVSATGAASELALDQTVKVFSNKIRSLEDAALSGSIDVSDKIEGGVWLNDLTTLRPPMHVSRLPAPKEGYQERVRQLALSDTNAAVGEEGGAREAVARHRGFQIKRLENMQVSRARKLLEVSSRIDILRGVDGK